MTNVTAVSSGDGGTAAALLVRATNSVGLEVTATNVIAYAMGDAPDIVSGRPGRLAADLTLADSNYDSVVDVGIDTSVTPPERTAIRPMSRSSRTPPAATSRRRSGLRRSTPAARRSPRSACSTSFAERGSATDAPDIGAYEFVPPPDTRAPNVSIPVAPKGRIKTTKRFVDLTFELASDEPDVVFECKINRIPTETCTSPVTFRLEATKGIGTTYTLNVRATMPPETAAARRSARFS